ncbi:MAG: class I SAM-dependent methyltransferase [bacterium]|nr:class I SAM-dependent methyltransferase [bacterium]
MNQNSYARFAPYYDALSFDEFSKQCVLYLDQLLATIGCKPETILDLACGTGTAAILLAKQGYRVTGIDISEPMLKLARKKAKKIGLPIKFSCQDMRNLTMNQRYDLVTCFFDAMNHLYTYRDFERVCRNVGTVLHPNGLFMFDLNTEFGLKTFWNNKHSEQKKKNLYVIFQSSYSAKRKRATVNATIYVTQKNKVRKITTQFANRAYTAEQVHRALRNAGLIPIAEYDCFTLNPGSTFSSRIMYLARKNQMV